MVDDLNDQESRVALKLVLIGKHIHSPVWDENKLDLPLFERLAASSEKLLIISLGQVFRRTVTHYGNATMVLLPKRNPFLNNILFVFQAFAELAFRRKNEGWNVVGASEPVGGGLAATLLNIWMKIPYVAMMQGDLMDLPKSHFSRFYRFAISRLMLLVASRAKRVRTVSETGREKLVAAGMDSEKIIVLHNRVDLERFNPLKTAEFREEQRAKLGWQDSTVLVFAGAMTIEKGFGDFVEAAGRLLANYSSLRILLIGDGELRARAEALASRFGDRVHATGFVAHSTIHNWISLGDILAFCSHHEGMPRVILEYMAMGKPIVTTDVGGIGEVISDGESGIIVETGNSLDLQNKVSQILNNPDRFADMGPKARRLVEARHDLEKTISAQISVYKAVAWNPVE